MKTPTLVRPHPSFPYGDNIQKIYRFENGYGASVVRFAIETGDYSNGAIIAGAVDPIGSYGVANGLWELAVVKFDGDGDDDFEISYDTHITDDVLGYLTEEDVENTLVQIESL